MNLKETPNMISFIVPVYNAERYLQTCLNSLLAQTVQDLQIILVDDGSTDGCWSVVQSYAAQDKRVEVYRQAHAGQSAARNKGLTYVKGDYIAFVDADDSIEADWCETMLRAIDGVDYVQAQAPRNPYQYTVVWGRLYRRQTIENLPFIEGMIYEDIVWSVDLWMRDTACRVIDYKGYHYTENPNSTTSQRHPEAEQRVFAELKKRLPQANRKGKMILLYTIIRLKIHFLKS